MFVPLGSVPQYGYSGCWKMLTISMRSSPAMMSSVPLPWCTSKSTMATRSRPRTSSAWRAAMATLLKKQKPMASSRVAWWPGGRTAQKALATSPSSTASVAATAAPAARSTASQVAGQAVVSGSSARRSPLARTVSSRFFNSAT